VIKKSVRRLRDKTRDFLTGSRGYRVGNLMPCPLHLCQWLDAQAAWAQGQKDLRVGTDMPLLFHTHQGPYKCLDLKSPEQAFLLLAGSI